MCARRVRAVKPAACLSDTGTGAGTFHRHQATAHGGCAGAARWLLLLLRSTSASRTAAGPRARPLASTCRHRLPLEEMPPPIDDESDMINFGQKVDLCQRIRDVLANYPEGALLKEMVQNADDAGAGTFRVMLDLRSHGTDTLLAPATARSASFRMRRAPCCHACLWSDGPPRVSRPPCHQFPGARARDVQ